MAKEFIKTKATIEKKVKNELEEESNKRYEYYKKLVGDDDSKFIASDGEGIAAFKNGTIKRYEFLHGKEEADKFKIWIEEKPDEFFLRKDKNGNTIFSPDIIISEYKENL